MNCIKCPISEHCNISKFVLESDYLEGVEVPIKVMPSYYPDDCLLIKVIKTVEELDAIKQRR